MQDTLREGPEVINIPDAVDVGGMRIWDFNSQEHLNANVKPLIIITRTHRNETSKAENEGVNNESHEVLGALKEKYSILGRHVIVIEVPLDGLIDDDVRNGEFSNMGGIVNNIDPNRLAGEGHLGRQPNQVDEVPYIDDPWGVQLYEQAAQKSDRVNARNQIVLDYINNHYKGSPVLTIHADKFGEPLNTQEDDNRFYLYIQAHAGKDSDTANEYRLLWKSFCEEMSINEFGIKPKDIQALKEEQDPPYDINDPFHEVADGVILTYNSAYTHDGSIEDALHQLNSDTLTLEIPSCFDQAQRQWFVSKFLEYFTTKLS